MIVIFLLAIGLAIYMTCIENANIKTTHKRNDELKKAGIGPKCPACGGDASPLYGKRGKSVGSGGGLIGSLTKSMKCDDCGHLF